MKLRMHHIELCVADPNSVSKLLCHQLGLRFSGYRESAQCLQLVFQMDKATFVVTSRKDVNFAENAQNNNVYPEILFESGALHKSNPSQLPTDPSETWSMFCCTKKDCGGGSQNSVHVDSVFNVAIQVENVHHSVNKIRNMSADLVLQDVKRVYESNPELGYVDYAVIKSCCGNVVHTLVEKSGHRGWFLPGFEQVQTDSPATSDLIRMTHFDHFTFACRVGESIQIMDWYETAFGMKRFITNRYGNR